MINLKNKHFMNYTNKSINYKIYNQFKELAIYQFINLNLKNQFVNLKNEQFINYKINEITLN